jgi:hypothetical protein
MKQIIILFILFPITLIGQEIKVLNPTLGKVINKSTKGELEYQKQVEECEKFWKKNGYGKINENKLSERDKKLLSICASEFGGYWDVLGIGCSWYCGGGQDSISASSELISNNEISYSSQNLKDFSLKTAWVEGVKGYGIGEYVIFHVQPTNPRITEIIIINGYVKSDKAWRENSRVKKLKMYIDNKPYAILNLFDSKAEQHFKVKPLGVSKRIDYEAMKKMPVWTMRFEIMDVYKGDKYDDTAITEIYFDGIDVH